MRSAEERQQVEQLLARGLNDCEIARRTGIPRSTVKDWRHDPRPAPFGASCGACGASDHDFAALPGPAYAYLLGQYLGDGHLVLMRRGVYRLRIFTDLLHLNLAVRTRDAMLSVLPGARVALVLPPSRMVIVSSYSKQWPCFFPQHGPGRKHGRKIELTSWQRAIVDDHPDQFVRGLIHSDGWRGTNNVTVNGKRYAYPRYEFVQVSDDIRRLFTAALDRLGIRWSQPKPITISIARRADVAALDRFIEPKS